MRQADAVDRAIEARLEGFEAFARHRLRDRLRDCLRGGGRGESRREHGRRNETQPERTHRLHLFCDAWST